MEPIYAPRPDGHPDPGEVVWAWVPYEEDATRGKDRPVILLARGLDADAEVWFALPMTSKDHDRDAEQEASEGRFWMDVGSGAWDPRGRSSEVRLDRLLRLDAGSLRREGAALAPEVFAAVVEAARPYLPLGSDDSPADR